MSTLGERIKSLRKEKGISAETLAEKVGVSPATMYRYEAGSIKKYDFETVDRVADVLNTTMDYLLGNTNVKTYYRPSSEELDELAMADPYNREPSLTKKDKRDIQDALDEMKQQLLDGDLLFDGKPVSDADTVAILTAMETAMSIVKRKNKETYGRKKE